MKYLKRYESFASPGHRDARDCVSTIEKWMDENDFSEIVFNPPVLLGKKSTYNKTVIRIYCALNQFKHKYYKVVIGDTMSTVEETRVLDTLSSSILKNIAQYLNNLTEDDIEQIHAEQEREKFNI